jgi:hypothetical protein
MPIERAPKSRAEIERLLLHELRGEDGCAGAAGIAIVPMQVLAPDAPNWTVEAFNPGSAGDYECELALVDIVARLQQFYELVQMH